MFFPLEGVWHLFYMLVFSMLDLTNTASLIGYVLPKHPFLKLIVVIMGYFVMYICITGGGTKIILQWCHSNMEDALKISLQSLLFMKECIQLLVVRREKWFEAENWCKRWAVENAMVDGVFCRDLGMNNVMKNKGRLLLKQCDPYLGVPPVEDLPLDSFVVRGTTHTPL